MSLNRYRDRYRIPSNRMRGWDYSSPGYYFVTICTQPKIRWFGEIQNGIMCLNEIGSIAHQEWLNTQRVRNNIQLDEFIVMPDHIHGIICIIDSHFVETHCNASLRKSNANQPNAFGPQYQNLPSIIRGYKGAITRRAKTIHPEFRFQSRYFERLIRTERELLNVRNYIRQNPIKWRKD